MPPVAPHDPVSLPPVDRVQPAPPVDPRDPSPVSPDAKTRADDLTRQIDEIVKADPNFAENPTYIKLSKDLNEASKEVPVVELFNMCKGKRCPCGLCSPMVARIVKMANKILTRPLSRVMGRAQNIPNPA
jgi:hypothetical protein